VTSALHPSFRYYRDLLGVRFRPGTSAARLRAFAAAFAAKPHGAFGTAEQGVYCVFRFPDPGPRWEDLQCLHARVAAAADVLDVFELSYGELPKLRGIGAGSRPH
jgi:hypothetical protein